MNERILFEQYQEYLQSMQPPWLLGRCLIIESLQMYDEGSGGELGYGPTCYKKQQQALADAEFEKNQITIDEVRCEGSLGMIRQ